MLQDFQPPNNHQLRRYVTDVGLTRAIYVSVKSVTSWPCDEMTGSRRGTLQLRIIVPSHRSRGFVQNASIRKQPSPFW